MNKLAPVVRTYTDEWKIVQAHCEKQIESCRDRLEARNLTQADSEFERGQIRALRQVLALAPEAPAPGQAAFGLEDVSYET